MTQAGGPAAINGFLYQIIHHLGWLSEVAFEGTFNGAAIDDALMVLEPAAGGDAQASGRNLLVVEQYKTREDGTWSVGDIIAVLRDLRRAVPASRPDYARYRFVTNGRPGRLDAFEAFLTEIRAATSAAELDNSNTISLSPNLAATARAILDRIAEQTRPAAAIPTPDEPALIFHLLAHLELTFESDASRAVAATEALLRRYASDLGEEQAARQRLVGILVEMLGKGERRLTAAGIEGILRRAGLNTNRLRRLSILPETLAGITRDRTARIGYHAQRNVRSAPRWPLNKPVLVITGQSGSGKTWLLGRLLDQLGQDREPATLVASVSDVEQILAAAARDIWVAGLQETSERSLVAVSTYLAELRSSAVERRITIAVDDIQDVSSARALVRQDWTSWNMRLVMTVPHTVVRSLELTDAQNIQVEAVADFTVDELDRLLQQSTQRWADLPEDLKKLLRSPILAGIYVQLPHVPFQRYPRSEYEIFDAFWKRIATKGEIGDEGIVLAFADMVVDGRPYPLPRQSWRDIGLDVQSMARLDSAGWLRASENGDVAFAHDRLLNWVVAKALVRRLDDRTMPVAEVAAFLADGLNRGPQLVHNRLGYIQMDACWLLTADDRHAAVLDELITGLENARDHSDGTELYVNLLPTLGQRAVNPLIKRLDSIDADSDRDYRAILVGRGLAQLARQDHVDVGDAVSTLIASPSRSRQNMAIAALTAAPDDRHLDRLWTIHQLRFDGLTGDADGDWHSDYRSSFAAMQAAVARNPGWLRRRILDADASNERVSELGFLLHGLDHPDAPAIWEEAAEALFAKASPDRVRCLLLCIARFRDGRRLDFVINHLKAKQDFTNGTALYALSVLDPRAALERLVDVDDAERSLSRDNWLPGLLRASSELTHERILTLATAHTKGRSVVEDLFASRPNEASEDMIRFVVRRLEHDLRANYTAALTSDPIWLYYPLDFLSGIARLDFLQVLHAEASGELERMLTEVACSRLGDKGRMRDHVLEGARRILILIGGDGIRKLIIKELESDDYWSRHGGLRWAIVRDNDDVVAALAEIAHRPLPRGDNKRPSSNEYAEFYQAMTTIAAHRADSTLVDVLNQNPVPELPRALASLRALNGPMPATLTAEAVRTLESSDANENKKLAALAICWLSGNEELIAPVRAVLATVPPESKLASYACFALDALDDQTEEFVRLAYAVACTSANAQCGLDALIGLGEKGLQHLQEWFERQKGKADLEISVIRSLFEHPKTRAYSINAAVRCVRQQHFYVPYEIVAEADEPAIRERIRDKAFASRSVIVSEVLSSIEGLAKFDAKRAVEAIQLALRAYPKSERELCRLLIRIAPGQAAYLLVEAAVVLKRQSLWKVAAQALRVLPRDTTVQALRERMNGSASERKAAAAMAAWLPSTAVEQALGHLADSDPDVDVRPQALRSLERLRMENHIETLFGAFPTANANLRWSLLTAILNAADPWVLSERDDPQWLGRVLTEDVPEAFAHHAAEILNQRRKKDS
jgi:hypothetical protein